MNLLSKRESGQAFILVLILLLMGGLMLPPLLSFVSTGLKANQVYEEKTDELYAADAGVEYAIYNIRTPDAPFYDELQALAENGSYILPGSQEVNNLPINVTVTKLSLMEGLVGEDEYKLDRPHEGWVSFGEPQATPNQGEGWVEYVCHVSFHYDGTGRRGLKSVGAFFSPFPGDEDLIEGPYGWEGTGTGVITFTDLEADSPQAKIVPGGFAFIWRWATYPTFDAPKNKIDGAFDFKFKIYSLDWGYTLYFVWSTFKEQDISYVTNAPGLHKWLIEATAGDTTVRSAVIEDTGALSILTWEINPLH